MCSPVHHYAGRAIGAAVNQKSAKSRPNVDRKPTSRPAYSSAPSTSSYDSTPDYSAAIVTGMAFDVFDSGSSFSSDLGSSWGDGGFSGGGGGDFGGGGASGDW